MVLINYFFKVSNHLKNQVEYLKILIIWSSYYFNYLNKIFLGETGCILISYYISYFFIKSYNIENVFFADQIILYLLFPGLDLFRLFFYRIINKKNPFAADANHLHHYLLKMYEPAKVFIIIFLAYALPIIVSNLMNNFYLGIIFTIINYSILLKIYGNKKTALRF